MTRKEEIEQEAGKAFPLPPLYNEEQRRSKQYAESWARARDQQWGFQMGAMWADKTMIDKACEWLEVNVPNYFGHSEVYPYLKDFRKAMEGE